MARVGPLAGESVGDVVAVEMDFESLVADFHPLEQLFLYVGHTGGRQQGGSMSSWAKTSL